MGSVKLTFALGAALMVLICVWTWWWRPRQVDRLGSCTERVRRLLDEHQYGPATIRCDGDLKDLMAVRCTARPAGQPLMRVRCRLSGVEVLR